ncbi:hypothetical protein Taro_021744, partial [Colocasia esculenta]|nr:hypothetical protein [Colocasia esculenta]
MTPPHQTPVDLTKDDDSAASGPGFKLTKNKKGKYSITPNEKRKRRRSKEPSSSFTESMVEATKEFKKSSMPASYDMIQQCVEIIMAMDLTISEKARAADLIRKDNAYLDCIGAIDGTHILAEIPANDRMRYRNRKGQTSQNVMAVYSFDMCFLFVNTGYEGSCSVSTVRIVA